MHLMKMPLLVTVSACLVAGQAASGFSADKTADSPQQKAAKALRGKATNVQFNRDKTVRLIRFSKAIVTDATLERLRQFPQLDYLSVDCPQITDAGIAHIAGLTNLDSLLLSGTQLTDAGLVYLKKLTILEHLHLAKTKISDAGPYGQRVEPRFITDALRELRAAGTMLDAADMDGDDGIKTSAAPAIPTDRPESQ